MPESSEEKIDAIDEILDAGMASVNTDGQQVTFVDPAELRQRRRELDRKRRPVAATIDLSGF